MAVREIYTNGEYLQRNPGWHVAAASWKAQAILRMMTKHGIDPQTVCEIGCGSGEILRLLQTHLDISCTFSGYEISPQAYDMATSRENERLHFHLADFQEMDRSVYDLILLIDVVQHFENWFGYLKKIKAQSTYKILQLPLDVFVFSALRNELINYHRAAGHLHFFTKDVALELLRECGYEVVDYWYTLPPLATASWREVRHHPGKLLRHCVRLCKRGLQRLPGGLLYLVHKDLAVRIFGGWRLMVLVR
ncbi:MAG TPA: methyltransferase domain-containing protein [Ktedonobacteraceae bacterium]|jgi:hypothetical protein|nr:methyltransferase domain-containing protein [Ktedonobacteraceae bacterium]